MARIMLSSFCIIFFLLFVPIALGQTTFCLKQNKGTAVEFWLYGFELELFLFAITYFFFSRNREYNLRIHGMFYVFILGILLVFAVINKFIVSKKKGSFFQLSKMNMEWTDRIVITSIVVFGAFIILNIVLYKDEVSFSTIIEETVNSILQSNTTGKISPYTGTPVVSQKGIIKDQMILAFWAFLAWSTHIHPIVLIEYILPLFFVLLFYTYCLKIGREMFNQDTKKVRLFILSILLLHNMGNQREWLLFKQLREPWTGEHLLAFMVLPVIVLGLMKIGSREQRSECWYELIIVTLTGILLCETGWFYISVVAVLAIVVYVGRKLWKC